MIQCLLLQLPGYKILNTMDKCVVPFFDKKFSPIKVQNSSLGVWAAFFKPLIKPAQSEGMFI